MIRGFRATGAPARQAASDAISAVAEPAAATQAEARLAPAASRLALTGGAVCA